MRVLTASKINFVPSGPTDPVAPPPAVVVTETLHLHSAGPAIPPQMFPFPVPFVLPKGV